MNKIWVLIIFAMLLTACTVSQTETPAPTPTPNPYTADTLIAFCKAAVEGDLDSALELVTEDVEIIFAGDTDGGYEDIYEGYDGVEELLSYFQSEKVFDCTVRRFDFNGDEVKLWWTHSFPYRSWIVYASCEFSGSMQGEKIHKIYNHCVHEFWLRGVN